MKIYPQDFIGQLQQQAQRDPWYLELQAQTNARESDFLSIRSKLTTQEQAQLDLYIAACEEQQYSLSHIAYEMGKRQKRL